MGDIEQGQTTPLVSVVIPILNEVRTIDDTLASVLGQTYRHIEVLAVDGMSDDGTIPRLQEWADRDERVRVLPNPRKAIPVALNIALEAAEGRFLIRVDAHSTIPDDYVERMVAHLKGGEVAGVGAKKTAIGGPPNGQAIAAALGSPFGVGGSAYHYATEPMETDHIPFGAYRIDLARQLGGWDERLVANEDFEFDVRVRQAGGKLFLDPSVEVLWKCRSRIRDLAAQYRRYGRGKADVAYLHPSEVRLRHLAPPVAVAAIATSAVLVPWVPMLLPIAGGGYVVAVLGLSVPIGRKLGNRDKLRVPGALAAMQLAWGWGMWEGLARIARHGFRLPVPSEMDASRWGSPDWHVESDTGSDPDSGS